ncbi:hypothetical protein ACFUKV_08550 [Streptomyces paradoxus]|uniref:hypothetical protein n=1 Tax=Streptomyces paradoxus TaxID=66375 RepID=UPI0036364625
MTEAWTQAVRHQLDLGRLLPLGGPDDGHGSPSKQPFGPSVAQIPGVRVETLHIGAAPLESVSEPAVRPPASALPPGS